MQLLSGFVCEVSMINVNFLPQTLKKEISQAKKNREVRNLILKVLLMIISVILFSFGLIFYLQLRVNSVNSELNKKLEKVKEFGNLEEKSKSLADRITSIKKIINDSNKWSGVIEDIQKVIPSGVYLTSAKLDSTPNNRGQLSGYAQSKKQIAALRDEMEKSNRFQYVDIENSITVNDPLSNKEAESFTISFSFEKEAFK